MTRLIRVMAWSLGVTVGAGAPALARQAAEGAGDRCIAFITTNLAKGKNNFYTYYRFAGTKLKVSEGDVLSYRVYLDPRNPEAKGGIDADFEDGGDSLRELGLKDDRGVRVHGDGDLSAARGAWVVRKIDLSPAKGRTIVSWNVNEEGDAPGKYVQFIDEVLVTHVGGSISVIYADGLPPSRALLGTDGYTHEPVCVAVESANVKDGASLDDVIRSAEQIGTRVKALDNARREVELARTFAERDADAHLREHVEEAAAALNRVEREGATAEEVEAALHAASGAVAHAHPAMEKYTGHMVGHAHIDLQWLWEWQEGIVFSRDTFAQAAKFMDEFPGFTFSQSSSCLYAAMEEHYPELFAKIKEKIGAGQWEVVGGRVCEGDTNMISEESSARQFLYGQRYFREKFGKTAVVGWEPDTFGHTIQMPQMLKLAGCDYYYFCRGGKGKPLFWWQGLDGTKVLAFDEPATNSWYNSDLSYKVFEEMLDFERAAGSKDMLWVYGVGNHGGGPTREQIAWALEQMKTGARPNMRFSTATEFFRKLSTYDLSKIPVVNQELNPVFDGCYTTHCEIKQLNAQAESMTTTAEAVATVASLGGFAYPRAEFRRSWEEICFNHHHDTLPGSGQHAPYARTQMQLERVIASDRDIITRAMESMVVKIKPRQGGVNVLVFNPSGWTRSGWVEAYLVKSGWDRTEIPEPEHCVARGPDGKAYPVVLEDRASRRVRFMAGDVPAYGYRVFELVKGEPERTAIEFLDDGATIKTSSVTVEFDREKGCIRKVARADGGVTGEAGRLEIHWERPQGMSAWTLGKIERVEAPKPTSATFRRGVDFGEAEFTYVVPAWNTSGKDSRVVQRFRVMASGEITCDVETEWNGVGTRESPNALLRVAFDTKAKDAVVTYHVPFGALARPSDGREFPALQWVDVSGADGGVGVVESSMHGFSCNGSTLTMSLIRSSFEPDPVPNPGAHAWRYEIAVHGPGGRSEGLARRAAEFNQPLLAATVPYDGSGPAPLEWSLLKEPLKPEIMPTALKCAEGDGEVVMRMFECVGAPREQRVVFSTGDAEGQVVNFVEDPVETLVPAGGGMELKFRPFEIKTIKVKPGAQGGAGR